LETHHNVSQRAVKEVASEMMGQSNRILAYTLHNIGVALGKSFYFKLSSIICTSKVSDKQVLQIT
jgi:hypothetical protein